jgi:feruloyl esterase
LEEDTMRHRAARIAGLPCCLMLALAGCGGGGSDSIGDETPRVSDAVACADLQGKSYGDNTTITTSTYVTSDLAFGSTTAVAPFCRIEATARPTSDSQIAFEVWLPPLVGWNNRFQAVGSGSSAGSIATTAMAAPLAEGYAVMAQNNGHVTDTSRPNGAAEQTWALGHPEKIIDFAYRAQHVTTVHAKEIVSAYYNRPPAKSYFVGCSQGGHHALMEASRYPGDYDGIVAGAPAWEWFNLMAAEVWNSQAYLQDPTAIVAEKNTLLNNAVVAACDANDGVTDGVIGDPRSCTFDPAVLQCSGADAPGCLTAAQVTAAQRIYAGAQQPGGAVIFPPYTRGSEFGWSPLYSTPNAAGGSGFDFYRYTLFQDPTFDNANFDFAADYERARNVQIAGEAAPAVFNAGSDLTAFRQRGGKLIIYHGWADQQITPNSSIDYHDRVVADEGQANTSGFLRMFMLPGVGHCSGGPGPRNIGGSSGAAPVADAAHDVVRALDRWVVQGVAPESLIASRIANGAVTQTRPVCAWPKAAVYVGSGSTDDAANFTCR